ncbi:unnamed protein product, partial [marine sediment metagenome]
GVGDTAMDDMLEATSDNSPDPVLKAKVEALIAQLQEKQAAIMGEIHHSAANPDEAPEASNAIANSLLLATLAAETAGALIDIVHPIKSIGAQRIVERVVDGLGSLETVAQIMRMPVEKGLLTPLEYHFNQLYQPNIPEISELINIQVKDKFDEGDFEKNLAYKGFSEYWAGKIWDAHFIAPDYGNLLKAYYRTDMTDVRLTEL